MDTTVTSLFPDPQLAQLAVQRLADAGFPREQLRVVDDRSPDRHEFVHARTDDTKRGVVLGVCFGTVGGLVAGTGLAYVFGRPEAAWIAAVGIAFGGALLGFLVGRATTTQMHDELEHELDAGAVLVSVTTDRAHAASALQLLTKEGEPAVVATAATFAGGTVPANPEPGR